MYILNYIIKYPKVFNPFQFAKTISNEKKEETE